jgi:hypothetical protein
MARESITISSQTKDLYGKYFGVGLGDQDKPWAPKVVCKSCPEMLRQWAVGKLKALPFGIPMVWREPVSHDECYFCQINVSGFNKKTRDAIVYPNFPSAVRPVAHDVNIPVPSPNSTNSASDISDSVSSISGLSHNYVLESEPILINQKMLNDLVRDLDLSKQKSELLGSRLKEWNLLDSSTHFSWFRHRERELSQFFSSDDCNCLSYCNNIPALVNSLGIPYQPEEWRLFIDGCKTSLKAVLLHNSNKIASIPIAHSFVLKESYKTLKQLLIAIDYPANNWLFCGDLKVISIVLGLQNGYTKHPCYLCEWDSRAKESHYFVKEWKVREQFIKGKQNVVEEPLVPSENVLIPSLHLMLGLVKQFVKSLPKDEAAFVYLLSVFSKLSEAKVKEGIFNGPDVRKILNDRHFQSLLPKQHELAWVSFRDVVKNFLGNKRSEQYVSIVAQMITNFHLAGCKMSLKVHFLDSHLDKFPSNCGQYSEQQGERFHQDIAILESRYRGKWNTQMMADYCWSLIREDTVTHSRKTNAKSVKIRH